MVRLFSVCIRSEAMFWRGKVSHNHTVRTTASLRENSKIENLEVATKYAPHSCYCTRIFRKMLLLTENFEISVLNERPSIIIFIIFCH
jgi:hypothetical protein